LLNVLAKLQLKKSFSEGKNQYKNIKLLKKCNQRERERKIHSRERYKEGGSV
jgi:hypothetical protein